MSQANDTAQAPAKPREVMVKLQSLVNNDPHSWEDAWKAKITPWDLGEGQPPLRDILTSGEIEFPRSGRALVPGCGRGYDAACIASSLGHDTLAIDIAATAVQEGKDYLASLPPLPAGKVSYLQGDFFNFQVSDEERFDLIYDFTFFVAIPPTRRNEWGRQMRTLIKPGGYLITLIYPIDPHTPTGPPYFVRPDHYLKPLGEGWAKVVDRIPENSLQSHVGREHLVVWRRL
ncbi:hypothetical protein PC9H_005214 [Pleurotus ostreatus]|uniref:S-adenosyl-L-methionine-dependent methyltransferase n=1 Tax=Pleurotus ostreatus TaxID=5322 RepID=A0A8H6ZZH2_PLEOS|nr:uncharacterized protein PC9H_005214 [Pleurotus ostreatus]KAF7433264.1 hypothetical protein PC9H_005214 [Pleurotus ostreatus]